MYTTVHLPLFIAESITGKIVPPYHVLQVLLNEDLIKVNQDPLKEGGSRIGSYNCPQGPQYCQIWAKKLHPPGTYAVAMYNSVSVMKLQ